MHRKKIIFIKSGSFSNTNFHIKQILEKNFPDFKVDVIDTTEILIKHKLIMLVNLILAFKEYKLKMLESKKQFFWYFFASSYLFKKMNNLITKYIRKEDYLFSFQSQSMFDTSVAGIPHFVYTDNVEMANLYYSNVDKKRILPTHRIKLEKQVFKNADKVFLMSTNVRKALIEFYECEPEKVVCVYAGSNVKINNSYGKTDSKYAQKNILFVGVDWLRKGGETLVAAFKKVLDKHPDAKLTIVGCSPTLDIPNCDVVGRVPLEKVASYYEEASIFCLPTTFEPFGIVFVEALMNKLPVVATDIGAIPDFISHGENGYLVKPNNVEELADALINLLADPSKCKTFGENGYRLATERYSWEKVGQRMKKIIEQEIRSQEVK